MKHPYSPPFRINGVKMKSTHHKYENEFAEALRTYAESESKRYGVKISPATLIRDLLTRDDPQIRLKRTELRQQYRKIKEKTHHDRLHEAKEVPDPDLF